MLCPALPGEMWALIAAYPGTGVLMWVSRTTRKCWEGQNVDAAACPHVAFIRRAPHDIRHMPFADGLTKHLLRCPERSLSCWKRHPVDMAKLNRPERRVAELLLRKAAVSNAAAFAFVVTTTGISVAAVSPADGADRPTRRQPKSFRPHADYDADMWALYLRLLFLAGGTRVDASGPTPDPLPFVVNKRVRMQRRWTPGAAVRVYRSTRGFHACHYLHEDRPPRGSFVWLLAGTMREDRSIDVTSVNARHPLASFVESPHCASRSDLYDLTFRADVWP